MKSYDSMNRSAQLFVYYGVKFKVVNTDKFCQWGLIHLHV